MLLGWPAFGPLTWWPLLIDDWLPRREECRAPLKISLRLFVDFSEAAAAAAPWPAPKRFKAIDVTYCFDVPLPFAAALERAIPC